MECDGNKLSNIEEIISLSYFHYRIRELQRCTP